jgi:hypothetical protein
VNGITPELATKVLEADDANILQKAKSGKALTKFERERFEQIRDREKPAAPAAPASVTVPGPTGEEWETKVCDSMKQAVGLLNAHGFKITWQELRALTKDAKFADAFRGNRVYLEKLLPPLRTMLQSGAAPASGSLLEIATAEAELRIKNAKAIQEEAAAKEVEGKYTETQLVIDAIRRLRAKVGTMGRKFRKEAPADMMGKDLAARIVYCDDIWDNVEKAFADLANEFNC